MAFYRKVFETLKMRVAVGIRDGEGGHQPIQQVLPLLFEGKAVDQVCEAKKKTKKTLTFQWQVNRFVCFHASFFTLRMAFFFFHFNTWRRSQPGLLTCAINTDALQVSTPPLRGRQTVLACHCYSFFGYHFIHSNVIPTIISPPPSCMSLRWWQPWLHPESTTSDPVFISLFDSCEGGSDGAPHTRPWIKALARAIYWCVYSFRDYSS